MGSDATVYIFDDDAFRDRVCPAVRRFVDTGVCDRWLEDLLGYLQPDVWEFDIPRLRGLGFSFDAVCHYLDPTFAYPAVGTCGWMDGWDARACASKSCPARVTCPLHTDRSTPSAEDFIALFTACVIDQCLGPGQFVGRTVSPEWYDDSLAAAGIGPTHPAADLLRRLGTRGYVVGYAFANSDGVHGWLTRDEARDLHTHLTGLDLPRFPASFEVMEGFRQRHPNGLLSYVPPAPYTFKQLSLAFVRAVAELAVAENKGVLWGNDLPSYWKEDRDRQRARV
jgi:hypothetical protein